jgi:anti-sigma-K factor RskA
MMPHDEMLDNVALYALGTLPAADAAAVAEHLRTCGQCREEYLLLRPTVTAIAYSAEACANVDTGATVASPLLKARVMQRIRSESPRPQRAGTRWAYAAVAAGIVALLIAGIADISLTARVRQDRVLIAQQSVMIADFAAKRSKRYPFNDGVVLTNGRRLYIAAQHLPVLPPGRVYQAWTLTRGAKVVAPSLTFAPGSDGDVVVPLPEDARTVAAVAVSVEPRGGSRQPTTEPIAVVSLGR